jgi:hypothetical protein
MADRELHRDVVWCVPWYGGCPSMGVVSGRCVSRRIPIVDSHGRDSCPTNLMSIFLWRPTPLSIQAQSYNTISYILDNHVIALEVRCQAGSFAYVLSHACLSGAPLTSHPMHRFVSRLSKQAPWPPTQF